jgi:hypothetical protein
VAIMTRCANPACRTMVRRYRAVSNTLGFRMYCSRRCCGAFPPSWIKICQQAGIEVSEESLRRYISELTAVPGFSPGEFCRSYGVSRTNFRIMRKKLGAER